MRKNKLKILRLGTRGSVLALRQANTVKSVLGKKIPHCCVDLVTIKTTGDQLAQRPFSQIPGKGVFIKEIEEALLANEIDLAVHSFKDLPVDCPKGLCISAVMKREDPRDCLITTSGQKLNQLPDNSAVGTGSLRRQAQVSAMNKHITCADIRGNLDTRLKKVNTGQVDAIVVAYAGVKRLGLTKHVAEIFSLDHILPAPGQGCLAIETREQDSDLKTLVSVLNHAPSYQAAAAERAFLQTLGGGCRVPIAAYAHEEKKQLVLNGQVFSPDGKISVKGKLSGDPHKAHDIGKDLGKHLLAQGAEKILKSFEHFHI